MKSEPGAVATGPCDPRARHVYVRDLPRISMAEPFGRQFVLIGVFYGVRDLPRISMAEPFGRQFVLINVFSGVRDLPRIGKAPESA